MTKTISIHISGGLILSVNHRVDAERIHEQAANSDVAVVLPPGIPTRRVIPQGVEHTQQDCWSRLCELLVI